MIRKTRFQAFTLIELLAVIAILALLAVLLVAGAQSYLRKSRQTAVTFNLRSLANSAMSYSADHEGDVFPYRSTEYSPDWWLCWLPTFYGDGASGIRSLKTPGDDLKQAIYPERMRGPYQNPMNQQMEVYWSYARNVDLPKPKSSSFIDGTLKVSRLPQPSRTMMLIETRQNGAMDSRDPESYFNFDAEGPEGKTSAAYVDGHIERVTRGHILSTNGTPQEIEARQLFWFGYPGASGRQDY